MWIEITLNITCVSLIQWDVLGEMVIIQNGYFGADVKCHLYCMESCKRGTYRQVGKYPQKVTHPEILNSWILSRTCLKCGYFKCAFPCFTQRTVSFSHTFYQIYSPLFLWPDFVPHGEHCLFDILGCSEMYTGSHVKFLVFFFIVTDIWIHWQIFVKIVIIKFHKNLTSGSHAVPCRQTEKKNPNHTSLNENYVVPCICLRVIWHRHGSMWRATRMTRDRKRIIVAHCVIALWRHYCRGCVEGHFSGYPSHKTYTCQQRFTVADNYFKNMPIV